MSKFEIKPPNVELTWKLTGSLPDGFDTNVLPSPQKGFMMAICGGRNTGKSVVTYNLLQHFAGCFDGIYVFSPTWRQDPTVAPQATGIDEESYFESIDEDVIIL